MRNALQRFDSPDALRFLFHAVAFLNSGKSMDLAASERPDTTAEDATPQDVLMAILGRDAWTAVRRTRGVLRAGNADALRVALEDLCLADPVVRPIVVAHAIKTTVAGFEEYDALEGHADREIPVLAAVRLLASPIVERRVHSQVGTSLRWVVDGEMPRKLTQ